MSELFLKIENNIDNGIALFGAGQNGKWCLDYLKQNGYKVNCFIDNSSNIQNTYINDIPVLSLDKFKSCNIKEIILITAKHAVLPILKLLEDYELKMSFDAWFYLKNHEKYEQIRASFEDEKSKLVLDCIIKTMLTGNEKYCAEVAEPNQYFCIPHFFNTGNEVFVDLGTYVGDTVEKFIISQNGSFKHIYAFEPSKPQQKAAKVRFKRLTQEWALDKRKISLVNAGVSDKTKIMSIEDNSLLTSVSLSSANNKNKIKVYSLDDYFLNTPVSFIKVDIEGAEIGMLKGAANIIKRDKPKFAISTYHKPDDLINIFNNLKDVEPTYKFKLRHHSSLLMETTLYCYMED